MNYEKKYAEAIVRGKTCKNELCVNGKLFYKNWQCYCECTGGF